MTQTIQTTKKWLQNNLIKIINRGLIVLLLILGVMLFTPKTYAIYNPSFTISIENPLLDVHAILIDDINFYDTPVYNIILKLPASMYHQFEVSNIESYMLVTYEDTTTHTLILESRFSLSNEYWILDMTGLGYDPEQIASVKFYIMQNFSAIPSGYYTYLVENMLLVANTELVTVNYYVGGGIVNTEISVGYIDYYSPDIYAPEGKRFIGWIDKFGKSITYYNNIAFLPLDSIESNSTIKLYAQFTPYFIEDLTPDVITPDTDSAIGNLFVKMNLDTPFGYIMVYAIVMTVVVTALALLKLPASIIIVMMIVVTGFFTYLGFLPFLVILTVFGMLTAALLMVMGKGRAL